MTNEVVPNLKPDPELCVCGCNMVGPLRVKQWADGLGPHVKRCPCRRCVGGRQSPNARRRENRIAKATGGQREPFSGALSGVDGRAGLWVWEETANESLVRGFRRWVTSKQVTRKMARMMARHGVKHAFVLSWDGKPRWVITPYEDWATDVKQELEEGA